MRGAARAAPRRPYPALALASLSKSFEADQANRLRYLRAAHATISPIEAS
jgi:hypothetical protein